VLNEQDGVHVTFVDTMLQDSQLPRYAARRTHRTYTAQFKADLVAACQRPGASIAALALHHGMNANVLHRWLKEYDHGRHRLGHADALTTPDQALKPAFIPVAMATPESGALSHSSTNTAAAGNIRIVCQRNGLSITVDWPASAARECAQMLREVLR